MDEMDLLRELDDRPRPDRARLTPGRQRLLDAAARGRKVRRFRTDWRFAAVGAVAAVTVAAVLAGQLAADGRQNGPATRLGRGPDIGTPAEILTTQADAVEKQHWPVPQAGQWVYSRSMSFWAQGGDRTTSGPAEQWDPYANPALENGKSGDDYSPRKRYQILVSLPDDTEGVLAKARVVYPAPKNASEGAPETQPQHDFRALSVLADTYPADPHGMAQVYRAMATVKGIEATPATDLAGRSVIAFKLTSPSANSVAAGISSEYLLDPKSHLFTGTRSIALADTTGQQVSVPPNTKGHPKLVGPSYKKGDVVTATTSLGHALVSAKGVRP